MRVALGSLGNPVNPVSCQLGPSTKTLNLTHFPREDFLLPVLSILRLCSNACFPLSGTVSTGVAGASSSLPAVLGAGRKEGVSTASLWPLEAIGKVSTDITGVTKVCHNLDSN